MIQRNQQRLQLANQVFDGEQLVLENCSGAIADCVFMNSNTTLTGKGVKLKRRSIYTQLDGAGVLVTGVAKVTFLNCVFKRNRSCMCGGGVSLQCDPRSIIIFDNCSFQDNMAADTGPAIDLLTPGMRVEVRNSMFQNNRSTGALTSKPIGQITVFPGNDLSIERCTFTGSDIDVDYHETTRKVAIATDKAYKIIDTSGRRNAKILQKVYTSFRAYLAHPMHYPWL